ncbi:hypothetical protein [Embleya sp. NPDC005971]|uniref:hypothetical protein n=1 Tax=unclassified Embleya TaxID=2699296 RepID=UPI00340A63E6
MTDAAGREAARDRPFVRADVGIGVDADRPERSLGNCAPPGIHGIRDLRFLTQ